jgi:hypothetical protein
MTKWSSRLETSSHRENLIAMLDHVRLPVIQGKHLPAPTRCTSHQPSSGRKSSRKILRTVTRTLTVICLAFIQGFFPVLVAKNWQCFCLSFKNPNPSTSWMSRSGTHTAQLILISLIFSLPGLYIIYISMIPWMGEILHQLTNDLSHCISIVPVFHCISIVPLESQLVQDGLSLCPCHLTETDHGIMARMLPPQHRARPDPWAQVAPGQNAW